MAELFTWLDGDTGSDRLFEGQNDTYCHPPPQVVLRRFLDTFAGRAALMGLPSANEREGAKETGIVEKRENSKCMEML